VEGIGLIMINHYSVRPENLAVTGMTLGAPIGASDPAESKVRLAPTQ